MKIKPLNKFIMKKVLVAATVAVFAIMNVNAQEVKFGVKAGVNFASISGNDFDASPGASNTPSVDGRISFHIGGVAEIVISENFSIQPELMYSSQGFSYDSNLNDSSGVIEDLVYTAKLDYINLPIIAKYYISEGFSIEAGPQIGYLMTFKYAAFSGFDGFDNNSDNKEGLRDIDFKFVVGVGFKMDSGLNFSARYNVGLSNVFDMNPILESTYNNVFQFSIGFMF